MSESLSGSIPRRPQLANLHACRYFRMLLHSTKIHNIAHFMPSPGEHIAHYRIIERLGAGGMGMVYKAEDLLLNRTVALKFLPPDTQSQPNAKERFMHEARAASALDHPNICTIHEIAETSDHDLYIVMGCYEGESLRHLLQARRLTLSEAFDITLQIASGLSAAHDKGIVHRDLKPENVIITSSGVAKILDFGLAKLSGSTQLTTVGTTLGTAAYMSPEQARGEEVDHRTDVYALVVILYELTTGQLPFSAEHPLALMYEVVNVEPIAPRKRNPDIPEDLEKLIVTGLQKDAAQRQQTVRELVNELFRVAEANGIPLTTPHQPSEPQSPLTKKPPARRFPLSRQIRFVLLGVAGVIVVGLLALFSVWKSSSDEQARQDAQMHLEAALDALNARELERAKTEAMHSVEAAPNFSAGWSTLAAISAQLNDFSAAATQAQRAIELDENNPQAHYNLAYALEERGSLQEALQHYDRAAALDSSFVPARNALGHLYIALNRPTEAIHVLQSAIAGSPTSEYAFLLYKNLGNAYISMKDFDRAIEALEQSLTLRASQDQEPYAQLALAYEAKGMTNDAVKVWRRYLSIETDAGRRAEAEDQMMKMEKGKKERRRDDS